MLQVVLIWIVLLLALILWEGVSLARGEPAGMSTVSAVISIGLLIVIGIQALM